MPDLNLMIPGPVAVEDDVLQALAKPTLPHYGPLWMAVYEETVGRLKRLFETENDVLIVPGNGTGALEMAISSLVPRGEGVVVLDNGFFGTRTRDMVEACGQHAWLLSGPWGEPADPDTLRAHLTEWVPAAKADGHPIRAVVIIHNETSTGVLSPLEALARVAREFGLAVIVDAVASFGGVRIPVDAWGIDVCVSVANKCLGTPPGVGLLSISPRAWEMAAQNPSPHGWYANLNTWHWHLENWGDWHPSPTTMPTNNVVALNTALKGIFERGVEEHFASFRRAAAHTREGMAEMGFTLLPDPQWAAPMISALNSRPDIDVEAMRAALLSDYGIMVSGGLGPLRGKVFRVGHMGRAREDQAVDALLAATRDYLTRQGLA